MKIVLLNGPPSSGKDTAAKVIRAVYGFRIERLSMPIKRAFAGMMNTYCDNAGNVQYFESVKEANIELFGASYRQWQIDFSEKFMKPCYGQEIFGNMLIDRLQRKEPRIAQLDLNYVIPDCGFQVEIDVIYRKFSPKDLLLIRLHRDGFDFSKDSRGYVQLRGNNDGFVDIQNNGAIADFEQTVLDAMDWWLKPASKV